MTITSFLLFVFVRVQCFDNEGIDITSGDPWGAHSNGNLAGGDVGGLHSFQIIGINLKFLRPRLRCCLCLLKFCSYITSQIAVCGFPFSRHGVFVNQLLGGEVFDNIIASLAKLLGHQIKVETADFVLNNRFRIGIRIDGFIAQAVNNPFLKNGHLNRVKIGILDRQGAVQDFNHAGFFRRQILFIFRKDFGVFQRFQEWRIRVFIDQVGVLIGCQRSVSFDEFFILSIEAFLSCF